METISGWLFFSFENNRVVFVAEGLEVLETIDWNVLLDKECLKRFVAHFGAVPTSEGPLQGYRIDHPLADIKDWLHECGTERKS